MSRDTRRLLKRPRPPRQWPRRACVLVGGLIFVVALAVAFAIIVSPIEFPPTKLADQWAAEGAGFGAAAFLLAVLATIIATIAYINSTEKPALKLDEADYPGRDGTAKVEIGSVRIRRSGDLRLDS